MKSGFGGLRILRAAALLLCMAGLVCLAAPKARADEEKDPPTRVARISYTDGNVSLQPGGQGDWGNAARNRPMTIGDKLWVDKDSRAELQAGQATIHLGSMTALSFLNLDAAITQMRLAEGSINFRVRELREGDVYELDAPNLAFMVKQAGAFRIDVDESGENARVTVIRGEGEVASGGKTYPIHAGERAEFKGTDNIEYNIERAPGPDGLDRWAAERDLKEDNSVSSKYVSREMDGYSDLDDNGTWNQEPEYGNVWYPNQVDPGWAPYSTGYWNYVGPWGWTWVDYAPWGFAPFHYGRWAFIGSRWGWCPGPFFGPAIYGPAFVGFLGGGFGFGFGVGFGVGWFPLGFGEPFHPWFHASNRFITNINIHNTVIRNASVINGAHNFNYAYAHNTRAVTAASRSTFVNGQAVNRGAAHITGDSLKSAEVSNHASFSPSRQSYLGAARSSGHVSTPPASVQNRSVMARTTPARGASNLPVHTMNNAGLTAGRTGNASTRSGGNSSAISGNNRTTGGASNKGTNSRAWEAQGNSTDRGRAPAGFGSSNGSTNGSSRGAQVNRTDRPPWAGSSQPGARGASNGAANNRSYAPPSRGYTPQQSRGNAAPRTYSAPSRSYPAPSRGNAAPSRGSSGGGSTRGGGSPHAGSSTSHGHS